MTVELSDFDRTTVTYTSPIDGEEWQLAGPDQNAHPVTLRRGVRGLWGPPVDVETRRVLQSRHTYRVGTKPKQLTIELPVHIAKPDYGKWDGMSAADIAGDWMASWPSDVGTSVAPLPGTLKVQQPGWEARYLDVYRTEEFEMLTNMDPYVAGSVKMLVVCASNDPYPREETKWVALKGADGAPFSGNETHDGDVAWFPKIYVGYRGQTPNGEVSIKVSTSMLLSWRNSNFQFANSQQPAAEDADFTFKVPGSGCFDLDPAQLTFTPGTFDAREKRFKPSGDALGLHWSGSASSARPIGLPWGQSAAAVVPPSFWASFEVKGEGITEVYVDKTSHFGGLML